MKRQILIFFVLLVMCMAAFAEEVAGTWKGEAHTNEGGAFPFVLTLKVDGNALTGTVGRGTGAKDIEDGKVSGDEISFSLTSKSPAGVRKYNYTGKLEGGKLKLIRQVEGSTRKQNILLDRE